MVLYCPAGALASGFVIPEINKRITAGTRY